MYAVDAFRVILRVMRGNVWERDAEVLVGNPRAVEAVLHEATGVAVRVVDRTVGSAVCLVLHRVQPSLIQVVVDEAGVKCGVVAEQVHVVLGVIRVQYASEQLGKVLRAHWVIREFLQQTSLFVPKLLHASGLKALPGCLGHVPACLHHHLAGRRTDANAA